MPDKVKITIDGKELEVNSGQTVLQAALDNGIEIPHFCYHGGLSIAGNCRMCVVEIEGAPKLSISCNEFVRDGLVIDTQSEKVKKARAAALEFLLINHPLDCSVCDKAGECMLQDQTYEHRKYPTEGHVESRMELAKNVPTTKELGPNLWIWANRCIHCSRCIRFTKEVSGGGELTFVKRGSKAEVDIHAGYPVDDKMTGNLPDVCPVGALLDKEFLYECRVWFLDKRESICPHCSKGCNISIESYKNEVKRVRPRRNDAVNSFWMCDDGRHNRDYFNLERITSPMLKDGSLKEVNQSQAFAAVSEKLSGCEAGEIAGLGSAYATCEDNFALRKLVEGMEGNMFAVAPAEVGEPENYKAFTIEAEKAPNSRGALAVLGLEAADVSSLVEAINGGKVKALVALGNDLGAELDPDLSTALDKLDFLLVMDSWNSPLAQKADVLLPAAIYAEKEGTFVNSAGRVQKISQCLIPSGSQAAAEWLWLKKLSEELAVGEVGVSPKALFAMIAEKFAAFSGLDYRKLGDSGMPLNK